MGNNNSVPAHKPNLQFRVLIIGRANAGKTTILQRVCDTTESPVVYRRRGNRRAKVCELDPSMERGEHSIEDELVFSNHDGYIFHDSCGFESGSVTERRIVQGFIRQMSTERRLKHRLHAIWYCVPMDNHRPELDLRYFKGICPDKNVPVIAVFTKYDQYLRNIQMHLEDFGNPDDKVSDEADRQFKEHYLRHLGEGVRFVRLEKMQRPEARCAELLKETVQALNVNLVALMLLAVQRSDLELNIDMAVRQVHLVELSARSTWLAVRTCLFAFPQIWMGFCLGDEDLMLDDPETDKVEAKLDINSITALNKYKRKRLRTHFYFDGQRKDKFNLLVSYVMDLPIIMKHNPTGNNIYHLRLAIVLILKHATILCFSGYTAQLALTQAESNYQKANVASKIIEHFTAPYQEYSMEQFIGFLLNTNIAI